MAVLLILLAAAHVGAWGYVASAAGSPAWALLLFAPVVARLAGDRLGRLRAPIALGAGLAGLAAAVCLLVETFALERVVALLVAWFFAAGTGGRIAIELASAIGAARRAARKAQSELVDATLFGRRVALAHDARCEVDLDGRLVVGVALARAADDEVLRALIAASEARGHPFVLRLGERATDVFRRAECGAEFSFVPFSPWWWSARAFVDVLAADAQIARASGEVRARVAIGEAVASRAIGVQVAIARDLVRRVWTAVDAEQRGAPPCPNLYELPVAPSFAGSPVDSAELAHKCVASPAWVERGAPVDAPAAVRAFPDAERAFTERILATNLGPWRLHLRMLGLDRRQER